MFERVIKSKLEKHLLEAGDLSERQFGFRKGRSTADSVAKVLDTVDKASTGLLYRV